MARVTISEIAARAGLSKGAVSYALNGQPGVSESTRARVLQIAKDLQWVPNRTAQALSGARSNAIGLVLARPAKMLGTEPFYMELIGGIEEVLSAESYGLLLQVASDRDREAEAHRSWWSGHQVDGVVVVDLTLDDPRPSALRSLGVPAVVLGSPDAAAGLTCVWTDETEGMTQIMRYLFALGHRRIGRVAGPADLVHVAARTSLMEQIGAELGAPVEPGMILTTDFSGEAGARATRQLLTVPEPPTAIIFDNDIMTVAGLSVAAELGRSVPTDVSLVAWDDSPLCRITHPPISALTRDIHELGAQAARALLAVLSGAEARVHLATAPQLTPRGSTSPP